MHIRALLFIVCVAFPIYVAAEPIYQTKSATIACDNPDGEKLLFDALDSSNGAPLPKTCRNLPSGYRFEALNRSPGYGYRSATGNKFIGMVYGQDLLHNSSQEPRYFNIPADAVSPVVDKSGNPLQACDPIGGGEIDRLVMGKSGQLFLKRYMVTTKCLNGVEKAVTKPLN